MKNKILAVFVGLLLVACTEEQKKMNIDTPAQELYGQLFTDVMSCDGLERISCLQTPRLFWI